MGKRPKTNIIGILVTGVVFIVGLSFVRAAGSASFSLSPTSGSFAINTNFTVTIYENSGAEAVNAVDAKLSYDQAKLQFVSINTSGSPFTTCTESTGGGGTVSIVCAKLAGSVTGSQLVGAVTFKALVGSGTSTISFGSNSHIVRASDASDVWNGNTTGGTYTLTTPSTPAPTPSPTPTPTPTTSSPTPRSTPTPKPTATVQQANPAEPVPATKDITSLGHLVAIRVVDGNDKTLENARITLAGQEVTTDSAGIASFSGITAGQHEVKAQFAENQASTNIEVTDTKPQTEVQEFTIKLESKKPSILPWVLAGSGLLALVAASLGLIRWRNTHNSFSRSKFTPPASSPLPNNTHVPTVISPSTETDYTHKTLEEIEQDIKKKP